MENSFGEIKAMKKKSLREEVYESLKRSILHGKMKAGTRLIEEHLAHQVGISRTPVREAFYKLEKDDLVMKLSTGGFVVREFTIEDVQEIFGIRGALEGYAAYLATLTMTPEKIDLLERKIVDSKKAVESGDSNKGIQLHTEFHQLLNKFCKSKKLIDMINNFIDYFYRYRSSLLHTENNEKFFDDHLRMLEAMRKKNAKLVESIVRNHMERLKEFIIKQIQEGKMEP